MKLLKKVVLIDDNVEFVEMLKKTIDSEDDFEVVGIAHNGLEGLEIIERVNPDLVLLDVVMPMLDGIGVLETAKEKGIMKETIFIVISAVGMEKITNKAISLGAFYYILKPIQLSIIMNRIRQFCDIGDVSMNRSSISDLAGGYLSKNNFNLEEKISEIVDMIGVPVHVKGYHYIKLAISMAYRDVTYLNRMTKGMYPEIADKYNATASRVERAIRNAIEITLSRGNLDYINDVFGPILSTRNGKIKNSEFIAIISNKIRDDVKAE